MIFQHVCICRDMLGLTNLVLRMWKLSVRLFAKQPGRSRIVIQLIGSFSLKCSKTAGQTTPPKKEIKLTQASYTLYFKDAGEFSLFWCFIDTPTKQTSPNLPADALRRAVKDHRGGGKGRKGGSGPLQFTITGWNTSKKKKKKKVLKLQALWLSLLCGQFRDWYLSSLHSHLRSWQNWENRKVNQHQLMSIHFLLCVLDILVAYNKRGKMLQNLSKHICNIIFMTIKKPHVISFFPLFHRNIFKQPVGFRLHQSHKTWFLFDFLLLIKWRWCKGEEHISSRKHLIGQQLVYTPLCARSVINIFSSPKQMHTYAKSCFWQLFSMSRLA